MHQGRTQGRANVAEQLVCLIELLLRRKTMLQVYTKLNHHIIQTFISLMIK